MPKPRDVVVPELKLLEQNLLVVHPLPEDDKITMPRGWGDIKDIIGSYRTTQYEA